MIQPRSTRRYALAALARYWPNGSAPIVALPIADAGEDSRQSLPPLVRMVALPEWAAEFGDGGLLVPAHCIVDGLQAEWERTDWLGAAFWHLNGTAERAFEREHGPIHSYSLRLDGWDARMWERAWVNRIALFLRRWAARQTGTLENDLLGDIPAFEIVLTHDVDAIGKTLSIRFKQCAFNAFNAVRESARGEFSGAGRRIAKAAQFLLGPGDYSRVGEVAAIEDLHGLRSQFNVYGGAGGWGRSFKQLLLDPAYDVCAAPMATQLRKLRATGWTIGLHQSFDAWRDAPTMRAERTRVEQALDAPVNSCRQHWLRFSWAETWKAQQDAGFQLDTTLGFNERSGFRNGAALRFRPWDSERNEPMTLEALPMLLMDSQFYDYASLSEDERQRGIRAWIDEVKAVRGVASVLWHPHTLSPDYGWSAGFRTLLECVGNA